jgi:SAM-dependent methyltransferase
MRARRLYRKLTGRKTPFDPYELSTPRIHQAVLLAIQAVKKDLTGDHLDVGSGGGQLLRLIASHYPVTSFACDRTDQLMETPNQKVQIADLNHEPLPYEANQFSLVTCVEIIEHIENFRSLVREMCRVLKPGGLIVISTPNILNIRSRLRFFSSGFYNLFGPLTNDQPQHTAVGHITPVNWFYLAHALFGAGFENLRVSVDKYQRRSIPAYALLTGPIRLMNMSVYRRDANKYRTVSTENSWAVQMMNSRDLLLGRTLIVNATKRCE